MWESTNGVDFCGVNRKILIRRSNLEIMSCGFPKEKKTYGQIQEKKVWSIQGTILFTQ
jgi:hypothetical protein